MANRTQLVLTAVVLTLLLLPVCMFLAALAIPTSQIDAEFRAWFPIILPVIAFCYSLLLAPFLVGLGLWIALRRAQSMKAVLVFVSAVLAAVLLGGGLLFRAVPGLMIRGAELIWQRLSK